MSVSLSTPVRPVSPRSLDGATFLSDSQGVGRCTRPLCSCRRALARPEPVAKRRRTVASFADESAPEVPLETDLSGSLRVILRRGPFHGLSRPANSTAALGAAGWAERAVRSPHMVFAPNAGLAAYPSWVPTLRALAAAVPDAPLVVTDYTEEAREAQPGAFRCSRVLSAVGRCARGHEAWLSARICGALPF